MKHKKEHEFLFILLNSALNQTVWKQLPKNLDWNYLFTLCRYHKIENLVSYALDYADNQIEEQIPETIRQIFLRAREKAMAREATQHFSLEELQVKFDEYGIYNMPLKGAQLKAYYPSPDMRFLTDLDILCQKEDTEKISKIMEELGYTLEHGGGHHDVYIRKPFMTVEIHWTCSTENPEMDRLFSSIWNRSSKWQEYICSYVMPWEDYYIYMVGHMAKHLKFSGIGIRMLLDFYIFKKFLQESCDWNYVEKHLKEANLLRFAHTMSCFVQTCLNGETLLSHEEILMEHILGSGAYGTMENHTGVRFLKDGGKKSNIFRNRVQLLMKIIFPPLKGMKQNYHCLKKYPFLLPFAWIERLVKKSFFETQKSQKILKDACSNKALKKMDKVCRAAGLY